MSLNESISKIRVELQSRKLKKSGKNAFAGFSYFELSDFLPTLNELMNKEGVNDVFSIIEDSATLTLVKGEDRETYTIPYREFSTPLNKNGSPSMQDIQYLGAIITYYKRYLYMNAFGITDGEVIDAMEMPTKTTPKTASKPQPKPNPKADEENAHKREIWTKFVDDMKHEEINPDEFLEFHKIKKTQKVKFLKFVEDYTSNSDLRNELVVAYKSSLE